MPVTVTPDPANVATATVTTNGATASDPITVSIGLPYIFTSSSKVSTDAGSGIVTGVAADGSSITFFAPPGTTTAATIDSLGLNYLPSASATATTDVPLTISTSVPSQPGTSAPASAPNITAAPAFYDGASFTGADITADGGLGAQYYAFTPAADGDFNISIDAQGGDGTTDADLVVCSDVTCSDGGDFTAAAAGTSAETGTFSLTGGTTYYLVVVLFAGTAPASISLSVQ